MNIKKYKTFETIRFKYFNLNPNKFKDLIGDNLIYIFIYLFFILGVLIGIVLGYYLI